MIEKDYILRLLLRFFDKIALFLSKSKVDYTDVSDIEDICLSIFGKTRSHLTNSDVDKLLTETKGDFYFEKLKLIAYLFRVEAKLSKRDEDKKLHLKKALHLLSFISSNSDTYDTSIECDIQSIHNEIKEV